MYGAAPLVSMASGSVGQLRRERMRGLDGLVPPTAHAVQPLVALAMVMPDREVPGGCGQDTLRHVCPFQCSIVPPTVQVVW